MLLTYAKLTEMLFILKFPHFNLNIIMSLPFATEQIYFKI